MSRIPALTHDVFKAVHQLRHAPEQELPPPTSLHRRLCERLDELAAGARQAGFESRDVDAVQYALAALLDETVLGKGSELQAQWPGRLLQLHYFNENVAGEGFFQRLDELRADPQRAEVLQVYYLCLLFGFRGRYAVRGMELELQDLIESLRRELERKGMLPEVELSPSGERPREPLIRRKSSPALLYAGVGALVVSVLLFAGLQIDLSMRVAELLEQLRTVAVD